jgi:hypothetical protein
VTPSSLLAQAAEADHAADNIFAKMHAAAKPDRYGSRPLIPAGFEAEAVHASDLRRRAERLRAEAGEMRAEATPVAPSPSPAPAAIIRQPAPPKPVEPVETAESVAVRIFNSDTSDSVAAGENAPLSPPAAADTVDAIVARILEP